MFKKTFAYLLVLLVLVSSGFSQTLNLFGGKNYTTFLGCLNCNRYDSNSVWNAYSTYGSRYSSLSIWNKYGSFGSKYSSDSPWNKYASNPPKVVDQNGNFYGYLSLNTFQQNRATFPLAMLLYQYHTLIQEDVRKGYELIFTR